MTLDQTVRSARLRRLSKEGVWVVLGQLMAVLGALFGVRLLTELLTPSAYGELALGMTLANLVSQTLLGPLGSGVIRLYAPAVESGDVPGYLNAVRRLGLSATALIVVFLFLVVGGLLIAGRMEWIAIATLALLFATLSGYNAMFNGIQNAARQRVVVAIHQGLEPWLRFFVAAGLLWWLGATSAVAMAGFTLAMGLVLGSQYLSFQTKPSSTYLAVKKEGRRWDEEISRYSWPFSAWGIFTWAQQGSDRWALGLFTTTQGVGLYAVLFQLGYYPVLLASEMALQLLTPILYQRAGDATDTLRRDGVTRSIWRLTASGVALTGVAFLVTLLFHEQIFQIATAAEYAVMSHLLPWMVLGGGIFACGQMISIDLMSQMKTRAMVAAKIGTAVFAVLLNFAAARWYGIAGVVAATVLFSVVYCVWMVLLSVTTAAGPGHRVRL